MFQAIRHARGGEDFIRYDYICCCNGRLPIIAEFSPELFPFSAYFDSLNNAVVVSCSDNFGGCYSYFSFVYCSDSGLFQRQVLMFLPAVCIETESRTA